jgi:hypothetical protein
VTFLLNTGESFSEEKRITQRQSEVLQPLALKPAHQVNALKLTELLDYIEVEFDKIIELTPWPH